ncbi:MliC family protein [Methyloprofundus sp.]|uniref:MliC family protein n=1 Tax=Methyloprofundus sp. TaxID=2020875 RepID=UPI003D0FF015
MKKIEFKLFLIFTLSILLNACSLNIFNQQSEIDPALLPVQTKRPATYVYECQNGYEITVNIEGRMAWLFLREGTLGLPKISSASGTKYSDGQNIFWSKGNTAMLETGTAVYKNCINNPGKAIWEHAKLKGADFRAVGNEPGWHLEIMHDKKLIFTRNYGGISHTFSTTQQTTDQATRTTVYTAQEKEHTLSVTILGISCQDTMSDDTYESTVTIVLNEKSFKGCGKSLH